MVKFNFTIDIQAAPGEVFDWIRDPEKARQWMTSVGETEMLSGEPNEVGSTFREVVSNGQGGTELYGEVTGYRENERFSFRLSGQFNIVDVAFRVEGIGERTRVTWSADMRFRSVMKVASLVFASKLRREITAQSEKELAGLKALCESS